MGETPRGPTAAFFDRFVKADLRSRSLGLGLAIVKAICEINRLDIAYKFSEGFHQIDLSLPAAVPLAGHLKPPVAQAQTT